MNAASNSLFSIWNLFRVDFLIVVVLGVYVLCSGPGREKMSLPARDWWNADTNAKRLMT